MIEITELEANDIYFFGKNVRRGRNKSENEFLMKVVFIAKTNYFEP